MKKKQQKQKLINFSWNVLKLFLFMGLNVSRAMWCDQYFDWVYLQKTRNIIDQTLCQLARCFCSENLRNIHDQCQVFLLLIPLLGKICNFEM